MMNLFLKLKTMYGICANVQRNAVPLTLMPPITVNGTAFRCTLKKKILLKYLPTFELYFRTIVI